MGKKILLLGAVVAAAFGSSGGDMGSDFIPRTINFLIFAAILYYLLKDRVVQFFENRAARIERQFQEIEERLRRSKELREELEEELERARKKAKEIVETAKREVAFIQKEIYQQAKLEIAAMEKSFEDAKVVELNRAKREVIEGFLRQLLRDIHLNDSDAVKLLLKGRL
jgi:F-type H+-transporting ATPase subunit b